MYIILICGIVLGFVIACMVIAAYQETQSKEHRAVFMRQIEEQWRKDVLREGKERDAANDHYFDQITEMHNGVA